MPTLPGEDLHEAALIKEATAGRLDGWGWNETKALSLSWFVGLASVLRQIESAGRWPSGLCLLGSALFATFQLPTAFGHLSGWTVSRTGLTPGYLTQCFVLAMVFPP